MDGTTSIDFDLDTSNTVTICLSSRFEARPSIFLSIYILFHAHLQALHLLAPSGWLHTNAQSPARTARTGRRVFDVNFLFQLFLSKKGRKEGRKKRDVDDDHEFDLFLPGPLSSSISTSWYQPLSLSSSSLVLTSLGCRLVALVFIKN